MAPKRQKVIGEGTSHGSRQHLARGAARQSRSEDPEALPGAPVHPHSSNPDSEAPVIPKLSTFRSREHKHRFHNDLIDRKMTPLYFLDLSNFDSTPGLDFVGWIRNEALSLWLGLWT